MQITHRLSASIIYFAILQSHGRRTFHVFATQYFQIQFIQSIAN